MTTFFMILIAVAVIILIYATVLKKHGEMGKEAAKPDGAPIEVTVVNPPDDPVQSEVINPSSKPVHTIEQRQDKIDKAQEKLDSDKDKENAS